MTKFGGVPNIQNAHAVFTLGKPSFKREKIIINVVQEKIHYSCEDRIEKSAPCDQRQVALVADFPSRPYYAYTRARLLKGTATLIISMFYQKELYEP